VETLIQSMKPEKPLVIEIGDGRIRHGRIAINRAVHRVARLPRVQQRAPRSSSMGRAARAGNRGKRMNPFERFAKGVVEFISPPAQAGPQGPLQVHERDARNGAGDAA
jgi:hypothetical protein